MYVFYRFLTTILTSFLPRYLQGRVKIGKEDSNRLQERYGKTNLRRPDGKLVWFHAASVGESLSLLKLLTVFQEQHPDIIILVTTGTTTSAQLMSQRLPKGVIHQYVPLDVPKWVKTFLGYWKPSLVVLLESEFWPNLIFGVHQRGIPLVLLNARLSDRSYAYWHFFSRTSRKLLEKFDLCITPSPQTKLRLEQLGAKNVFLGTNLKFTCDKLDAPKNEIQQVQESLRERYRWAAVSTHKGEEKYVLEAHITLKQHFGPLSPLTILVPRHPNRSQEILQEIKKYGLSVAQRSLNEFPDTTTDIWLIDTLGELGLIYQIVDLAFVGGSLVPVGGHNPIEAVQLNTAVLHGPYDGNMRDIHDILKEALVGIESQEDLSKKLIRLFESESEREHLKKIGLEILKVQNSGMDFILKKLTTLL